MLRLLRAVLAAKLLLVCGVAGARPVPESFAGLAQTLSPAVVNIAAEKPRAADGREARSVGSGFVIDASGLIVTNNHVVEGASAIYVGFADGSRRAAKIEGRDKTSDIALLRVDPDRALTPVSFGDSDLARAGDWVLAIGNPFGLGGSISAGIISARNRQLDSEHFDDFIQTSEGEVGIFSKIEEAVKFFTAQNFDIFCPNRLGQNANHFMRKDYFIQNFVCHWKVLCFKVYSNSKINSVISNYFYISMIVVF